MRFKSVNWTILLWLFIFLPIVTAMVFRKSFGLGLYGDDWQHLYNLWRDFFVFKTKSFFDIRSYLNPYWPEYFYLGIINHFWGYYAPAYFIASYLMRVLATITLYFFSFELTKSKFAAFLSTLFFLFSAAGLQTTDWVFNMNTYAGLGLLAIASTIYLKLRKIRTWRTWYYLSFIIIFTLALGIVPTRMHGAAPYIVLTDLFLTYIVEKQKIKFDKYFFARVMLTIGIFALLIHFRSFGEESYAGGRFNESYKLIQQLVSNGYYNWWLYFLATIGHLVFPDSFSLSSQVAFLQKLLPIRNPLSAAFLVEAFISIALLTISSKSFFNSKRVVYIPAVFNLVWLFVLVFLNMIDNRTSADNYFAISLGGQFLFWALWFYTIARKKYLELSTGLIIPIIWITCLTIIYWLFTPYWVIETTGRYMTMGAAGMAIFLGTLSTLLIKNALLYSNKGSNQGLLPSLYLSVPILLLIFWLGLNFQASQNYLGILYQTRNRELTDRTWGTLVKQVPTLDKEGPSVFYFTTDNPTSLQGVLVFGFFMRAGMTYRIPDQDLTPLPCTDYKELLAFAKDGSPLLKIHSRKPIPVPLSRIFAYDFRNGELINMSDEVRRKIAQDLSLRQ